ncbi:MAG: cyclic nucleotide-binding domain-containing protein [Deltaproteobacteria bacterium]|jgi:CRP/FNR family transcriptional regulator, cyclic AMP receptor protein|nr:cyclic nucleotide-binding domain-containing protein [Deltaproteobacteria bacterium]MBT4525378.1 cyclic nucleotide-binding domain-containing protein [Deltaproteobacteria bacterium]
MEKDQTIIRLKDFSLFADISSDESKIEKIAEILEHRQIKNGEYIFKQGDNGEELFILMSGKVRVCKKTKTDEEYTIVDLKSEWNVFFGEIALMDNDERSASILVLEDCDVLVMGKEKFEALGNQYPEICLPITRVIIKRICKNLRNVNNDVILLFDALVNEIESAQL